MQADNQIRFQDLENVVSSDATTNKLTKKTNNDVRVSFIIYYFTQFRP
mgnify:CR=1 FL=1